MSTRAVFFDAGETLVHPHPSFPDLFARVLADEGHPVEPALIRDGLRVVFDGFARAAEAGDRWTTSAERSRAFWLSVYRAFLARVGVDDGTGLPERLYAEFTDLANYRAFDDVVPVLTRLRDAGLALGLISNFEEWLERLLEQLALTPFFAVRVISGIEGLEKPDPRIFQLALDRAGVAAAEAVYVGDNPMFDTEPAEALGMRGVLIDRRGRFPDFSGTRLSTLADLPAAIGLGD